MRKESLFKLQPQEFLVGGGLNGLKASHITKSIDCLVLENCRMDKKIGAILERGGTTKEEVIGGEGGTPEPMGMGEYVSTSTSSVPLTTTKILSMSNGTWRAKTGSEDWRLVTANPFLVPDTSVVSTTRLHNFVQLGADTPLFIACGKLLKLATPTSEVTRVGIVKPTEAPKITGFTSGTLSPTSGYQYMFTFYDSTTGLESDWSEFSENTGAITSQSVTLLFPAHSTSLNYDKLRLYRTFDGGVFPYLVAELDAGTSTYTDSTDDADLTARAEPRYQNATPPENAFLVFLHANRVWVVDADKPNIIRYSMPYTGSAKDLEYFPEENYLSTNNAITGHANLPGRVLIFSSKSISSISGYGDDSFQFEKFRDGIGTLHHSSIASNGERIFFLTESGLGMLGLAKGDFRIVSEEIDYKLKDILSGTYNSGVFFSSCWNPSYKQFIFTASVFAEGDFLWEDEDTGELVEWEDAISFETATWEDVDIGENDIMKILCLGFSPSRSTEEGTAWTEYKWADIADGNASGYRINFVYHPQADSSSLGVREDSSFLGVVGSGTNRLWSIFKSNTQNDLGTPFTFKVLTGRILAGEPNCQFKNYEKIQFSSAYSDPTSNGATLKYLKDFDDAQIRDYTPELYDVIDSQRDIKRFESVKAKFINLYVEGESGNEDGIILSNFFIHYRETVSNGDR